MVDSGQPDKEPNYPGLSESNLEFMSWLTNYSQVDSELRKAIEDAIITTAQEIDPREQPIESCNRVGIKLYNSPFVPTAARCFERAWALQHQQDPENPNLQVFVRSYLNSIAKHLNSLPNQNREEQIISLRWFKDNFPNIVKADQILSQDSNPESAKSRAYMNSAFIAIHNSFVTDFKLPILQDSDQN